MFYQLPHVPVSPISSIDSLLDLFPDESPTSISEHPHLVYEFPPSIFYVTMVYIIYIYIFIITL